jgi:hypothetical protein
MQLILPKLHSVGPSSKMIVKMSCSELNFIHNNIHIIQMPQGPFAKVRGLGIKNVHKGNRDL